MQMRMAKHRLILAALAISSSLPKNLAFLFKSPASQKWNLHRLRTISGHDEIGVGIDLGTTNSAVAFLENGVPKIIEIPGNGRTLASVVAFDPRDNSNFLVGNAAIDVEAEHGCYRNVKRIIGRGAEMGRLSADVVPFLVNSGSSKKQKKTKKKITLGKQLRDAQENPAKLLVPHSSKEGGGEILPQVVSSQLLRYLFDAAEKYTGKIVTRAVIGVPAYFHDAQREATLEAARMAGVSKTKLLREPEAAALAYGIGREQIGVGENDELVLVFDLGGGTYDVSMLIVGGGLTEVVSTSGNSQLGGSDFDAKIYRHIVKLLVSHGANAGKFSAGAAKGDGSSCAADAIVRSAEAIRIYLSNNRFANLALPLRPEDWKKMSYGANVILPNEYDEEGIPPGGVSNSTHVLYKLSRVAMERLVETELLNLLKPIREVAIMSGALLPGDTSPKIVEAALEMEFLEDGEVVGYDAFYQDADEENDPAMTGALADDISDDMLLEIQEMQMKQQKKTQQKGRKKARDVAKRERKFQQEKRIAKENIPAAEVESIAVRDGISGRPISRVILVGGATRMPAIGRLLAAVTGVVPQKTVNPDEAVALGCAIQVGVLDGMEGFGTVLTPMQAAIMRAFAEQEGLTDDNFNDFDEEDFGTIEYL